MSGDKAKIERKRSTNPMERDILRSIPFSERVKELKLVLAKHTSDSRIEIRSPLTYPVHAGSRSSVLALKRFSILSSLGFMDSHQLKSPQRANLI